MNSGLQRIKKLIGNAKFLAIVFLVVVLLLLNTWYPRLRFESSVANYEFAIVLFCFPACLAMVALFARPRWIGISIAVLFVLISPLLAIGLLFSALDLASTLQHGKDLLMQPCSEVWQGSIRVRAFHIDEWLAGDGLIVRQEFRLMPGLLLVRDLYQTDHALGGTVSNLSPGVVRIKPDSYESDTPDVLDVKLRSFLLP